ncbi:hypothetical protein NFC81_07760 [Salinispirillum sp. LH 10-3-1]|uniref:Uncharacterized protein n=1 Tax=Salinispirillum sp. LH 10-3-1 TaxID=2952525 RepID=A0AB38YBD3_9GAMM
MYWEIVELEDGDIALVREDETEPMLKIAFSKEAKNRLQANHVEVAKAMIGAGMDAVEQLMEMEEGMDGFDEWVDVEPQYTTIH